jgi:two-component system, NtrC family, response regulator AtoC
MMPPGQGGSPDMPATTFVVDDDHTWSIERLVGRSPALLELRDSLRRIARAPCSPVLFIGETGTGRSLAARVLHHLSDRGPHPYSTVACKTTAATPLDEAIFGVEANDAAGGGDARPAALESLRGGTLFLSGVHATGTKLQQKLRRFLDEQAFTRVGGTARIDADVRIMASSDSRLDDALAAGRFARELYDRLSTAVVRLSPLRARAADVAPLVQHYIDVFNEELGTQVEGVTPEALEALESYSWPGNIRELRNVIERGMLVADRDCLHLAHLAVPSADRREGSEMDLPPAGVNLELLERNLVIQALQRTGGNQTRAATLLGLNRDQVRYRIGKFGLPRQ